MSFCDLHLKMTQLVHIQHSSTVDSKYFERRHLSKQQRREVFHPRSAIEDARENGRLFAEKEALEPRGDYTSDLVQHVLTLFLTCAIT